MNTKHWFFKLAKKMMLVSLICILCGCSLIENGDSHNAEQGISCSINYYIKQHNKDYADIYELNCIPGSDATILGNDYDLLRELINLEKIKFVGIQTEDDAQNFFAELSKLKNLTSVEIEDSHVGMIEKLGEIKNLKNLSITGSSGGGAWFQIKDLKLLGADSRFNQLQSLTLNYIEMEEIPNLSELPDLQELSVSGYEINSIDADAVNWENLISLEIRNTSVTALDDSIVDRLNNLQSLDISYSYISDVNFVLDLPNLQDFLYVGHNYLNIDMECIKKHPNFNETWFDN